MKPWKSTVCCGSFSQLSWKSVFLSFVFGGGLLQFIGFSPSVIKRNDTPGLLPVENDINHVQSNPSDQNINVIIITSTPRSGSSYTGELISASRLASYFFEPLWYFIDTLRELPSTEEKLTMFKNLLRCNFQDNSIKNILTSNKQSNFIFRKPAMASMKFDFLHSRFGLKQSLINNMESRCKKSTIRVIKTIRMNLEELLNLVVSLPHRGTLNRNNTHIVYLVRDPRGVINSIQDFGKEWPDKLKSPNHICSRMFNDSAVVKKFLQNLHIVRYEDIATDPWTVLSRLFTGFHMTIPQESKQFVQLHSSEIMKDRENFRKHHLESQGKIISLFNSKNERKMTAQQTGDTGGYAGTGGTGGYSPKDRSYYFSTYRNRKKFSPDHWRTNLASAKQKEINSNPICQQVYQLYNYPPK